MLHSVKNYSRLFQRKTNIRQLENRKVRLLFKNME